MVQNKVSHPLCYKFKHWKKKKKIDILNDIIKYITLVQLLDTVGNISHAVSISGTCISDPNYKNQFHW